MFKFHGRGTSLFPKVAKDYLHHFLTSGEVYLPSLSRAAHKWVRVMLLTHFIRTQTLHRR